MKRILFLSGVWLGALLPLRAETLEFVPREVFRIPFGVHKTSLGAKVEGNNFIIPRDFSMDPTGRFYINDAMKHRVVRLSSRGVYEMGIAYPPTARQVFAQPDGLGNLWLLISDPGRGFYYGVYDPQGKCLREAVFAQYNTFRLHIDDAHVLHVVLSNSKRSGEAHFYYLDEKSFLLKKIEVARPPEDHHQINKLERSYYIDPVPTGAVRDADRVMKITDKERRTVGTIQGRVVYVTDAHEIYTRVRECDLAIYSAEGSLRGRVRLEGLPSACASARFDGQGNVYLLDGTPDPAGKYTPEMPGMRLLIWERR